MAQGYLDTHRQDTCFGCEACKQVCPQGCIELEYTLNGFWYPAIDDRRCSHCDLCRTVCPYNAMMDFFPVHEQQEVYAACSKRDEVRQDSTSGGVFTELSEPILEQGGIVFGAVLTHERHVMHRAALGVAQLAEMRGSKYVQSRIADTYTAAETYLKNGKAVLFSGTPCQIAGLRAYLRHDYPRLITVDIICHGVVAPAVAIYHIRRLEQEYASRAVTIKFRDKREGWKRSGAFGVQFENGDNYWRCGKKDRFYSMFFGNYDLRESCYVCPFASPRRVGDITLGDFWGIENAKPHLFDDKGHNVVLANSEKGRRYFAAIAERIFFETADIDATVQAKLRHPTEPDIWRNFYLRSVKKRGLEDTIELFFRPRPLWKKGIRYIQRRLKSMFLKRPMNRDYLPLKKRGRRE